MPRSRQLKSTGPVTLLSGIWLEARIVPVPFPLTWFKPCFWACIMDMCKVWVCAVAEITRHGRIFKAQHKWTGNEVLKQAITAWKIRPYCFCSCVHFSLVFLWLPISVICSPKSWDDAGPVCFAKWHPFLWYPEQRSITLISYQTSAKGKYRRDRMIYFYQFTACLYFSSVGWQWSVAFFSCQLLIHLIIDDQQVGPIKVGC